jgi:hypothetical protein
LCISTTLDLYNTPIERTNQPSRIPLLDGCSPVSEDTMHLRSSILMESIMGRIMSRELSVDNHLFSGRFRASLQLLDIDGQHLGEI